MALAPRERTAGPLRSEDERALALLRQALAAADFTVERIESRLQAGGLSARPADIAVYARRVAGHDAFSTIARLFLLGLPVADAQARRALAPLPLEGLSALGLAEPLPDGIRAAARLVPHGDLYIASDLQHESSPETPSDYVAGIQAPSVTLAKLAVRRRARSALDLGTGCGIQALLAAKHSERVVATDVNPRALNFAAFNARLNGISNVEFRTGSGFGPVAGERFDLVVANPPYVVSPDTAYAYRDSGEPGDSLCRALVQDVPRHLAEDGFAHLLISWIVRPGERWEDPLRAWVSESGCDAWLVHYKTDDPLVHSASWLGPLGERHAPDFERALDRWLANLSGLDAEGIAYGAVVLRRRDGRNWVQTDELPLDRLRPASEHTLRVFAAHDYLQELAGDERLLDERFALAPAHRLEQVLSCRDGTFFVEAQTLALEEGLGFTAGVDRYTAALLPHFDGERPLRDVLARAATALEVDEDEGARFAAAALPVVRRLLELGFLIRAR